MNRSTPRSRSNGDRAEAVDDVGERDRGRIADGGQVDGRRPAQQQTGVPVDGRPSAPASGSATGPPARRRARQRRRAGGVGCPRRASGAARAIGPRHASCGSRAIRRAAPLPTSRSSRTAGRASVFRGPSGSRPGFPEPLADHVTLASAPVRMPDGRGRGRPASTGFSTNVRGVRRIVDNRPRSAQPGAPPRTGRPSVRRTTSMTSSTYSSALPCSAAVRTQPLT